MPEYRVTDIIIKSGVVKDDNGLFQAFLDNPIDLSYESSKDENTFGNIQNVANGLEPPEFFQNVKWIFKQNGEILSLIDGDYVDGDGNKIGTIENNTINLSDTFSINPLTLENILTDGNTITGEIEIFAIPGIVNDATLNTSVNTIGSPFFARIIGVEGDIITIDRTYNEFTSFMI